MTTTRSPLLDCLSAALYGPQDAPHTRPATSRGGRRKTARQGVLSALHHTAHRTPCSPLNSEGRNAA